MKRNFTLNTTNPKQAVHAVTTLKVPSKTSLSTSGNSISNKGDIIFNEQDGKFYGHNGTEWVPLTGGGPSIENLRMNQLQALGTHNSYRLKTFEPILNTLYNDFGQPGIDGALSLDYTHEPLPTQFDCYGSRSVELDIYNDPVGGQYYNRIGNAVVPDSPPIPIASGEPALLEPGFKLIHIIDSDYETNYLTLIDALVEIRDWSLDHPHHIPLIVLIETKETSVAESGIPPPPPYEWTTPIPFDTSAIDALDAEIMSVFTTPGHLVTPDDFRGNFASVNEAALAGAWPQLAEARGTIYVVINSGDVEGVKSFYIDGHPGGQGRQTFIFDEPGLPQTAFVIRDDPVDNEAEIGNLVRAGYMVRTRSDVPTFQARGIPDPFGGPTQTSRKDAAFASGAQIISTDYFRPDPRSEESPPEGPPGFTWTNYMVNLPNFEVARLNPVNGPVEFESLIIYD